MKNDLKKDTAGVNPVVHYALQLLAISILLTWCFLIMRPFLTPLIWAAVLATTLYPLHLTLKRRIGNRNGMSATIITVAMMLSLVGPAVWLILSTVGEMKELGEAYRSGQLAIPPPSEQVKSWPVIGSSAYEYWSEASTNITAFVTRHKDETKSVLLKIFDLLANTGKGIAIFALSIIICGFMLGFADQAANFLHALLLRIAGSSGESMLDSAGKTVRNVAKGVLGVAIIQSILAGIGFVTAGIPFSGLWILVCLILAIVQIGIMPVSLGVIIYIWGHADTTTALLLTVWMIFVGLVDNILKPILMGKGAPAPMLVVFIGALGGFMVSGFIGLFTGAIVLTLGYNLMISWVYMTSGSKPSAPSEVLTEPAPIES